MMALGGGAYLTAGLTYADARYGEGLVPANSHLEGKRVTQSPLWQSSVSAFVERDLTDDWRFLVNVNWSHIGQANTGSDLDPEKVRGAFNLVNAQLGGAQGRRTLRSDPLGQEPHRQDDQLPGVRLGIPGRQLAHVREPAANGRHHREDQPVLTGDTLLPRNGAGALPLVRNAG